MLQLLAIANLITAVQSLFLVIHFSIKKSGIAILNRLLALLCLCFAFVLTNTFINLYDGITVESDLIQDIVNNTMWFIGPSLYLYATFNQKNITRKRLLVHTLPYLVLAFIDVLFTWPQYDEIIPFIGFSQMCAYLIVTIAFCVKHYHKEKTFYSWILPAIGSYFILVIVNFTLSVLQVFDIEVINNLILQSFTLLLVIPIFYIAYKEMNSSGSFDLPTKKYGSTPINEDRATEILQTVIAKMEEEKAYRNTDLTLSKLSQQINVPSKYISQVINQQLNLSFSDYLVQLRMKEVKQSLIDPSKNHLTISGIAQECGFASSSRFNYLFKQQTGLTPSEFQKQHKS